MKNALQLASLVLSVGLAATPAWAADDAGMFYKDKVLRIVVGVGAGSGYDLNARTLARYIATHIPGNPTVIVQNQPGAGSMIMANTLYNSGPFDGLTIGAAFGGLPTAPLLQPQGVHFDPNKLNWLGSTNQEVHVTYVWKTAPVQRFSDLRDHELVVGAQAPGTTQYDFPILANALLGTHFKVIPGYEGTPQIHVSMEQGEVQGVGATAYTSLVALNGAWLADGRVKVIAQWGLKKLPELGDVPSVIDLATTDADRAAFKLALARLQFGRPFFLPPKVPADRVAVLRRAFDDTMKDPEFLAEEHRLSLDVDPLSGAAVATAVAEVLATPPDVVKRVRGILANP